MKSFGTSRPWPPDLGAELRQLFSDLKSRHFRGDRLDRHPDLKTMLDELDVWLADTRDYQQWPRKNEWQSLIDDLEAAAATRGAHLIAANPSIDSLAAALHPELGRDPKARRACLHPSASARIELATTIAAVAAFDDLVDALRFPQTSDTQVAARMRALAATFRCADRALVNIASQLSGVFANSALDVALARHALEGTDLPTQWPEPDDDAGLTVQERLDLARQLIARPTPPGHHVVWITYGNARFDPWRFEMGPVTFFDGPAMLGCFHVVREDPAVGHSAGLAVDGRPFGLPPEFLHPERGESLRDKRDWPNEEHWVAARIDLGHERYSDPIRVARDQADALVNLAAFHNGRTGWRPLQGHLHIVDDVLRSSSGPFKDPVNHDNWIALDHTDEALHDLHDDLEPHLPVDDPALHELINAAAVLNTAAASDDSAGLLQSARIIELIATRCDVGWHAFLTDYLATQWAQADIHDDIYRSVADLNNDYELREHFPELDALYDRLISDDPDHPGAVTTHRDIALDSLPGLAGKLPDHDRRSRTVRTIHHHTQTTAAIAVRVDELVDEYGRLVRRLLRCRNSLAHGGPINVETVAPVGRFVRSQARAATAVALWGAYSGQDVKDALDDYRDRKQRWRDDILTANTTTDAAFEPS